MKHSVLVLALATFTQMTYAETPNEYVRAGRVEMSKEDCTRLAGQASIVAFSSDTTPYYAMLDLNKGKAVDFFQATRKQLDEKLKAYCNDKTSLKTIDDFSSQVNNLCAPGCDENLDKFYKNSIFGESKEKKNAQLVCLSICNETTRKLSFLEDGARLTEKQRGPAGASPDCTGVVSDTGRSKMKEQSWVEIEKVKKTSEK